MKRYFLTGLLVLLPAWGTYLILQALFNTVDSLWSDLLGPAVKSDIPGLGIVSMLGLILLTGIVATDVIGQQLVRVTDAWVQRIPLVRSIYLTLKGMTDLFHFRSRFGSSTVVVFPFPREGLWALGFVMGAAPPSLRLAEKGPLIMIFVPTAIHPFTGYLAFIPREKAYPINLAPEDAMKMEFSAGLFHPRPGWLTQLGGPNPTAH
ncbi:MAG: DUF502 domain-containing protein [Nitrospiraceae bacterium]|jgi:uncharacterized membrane protein|nr:DUF502 domain-containing protein [Nitrospiraceae bacterium]